MKELNEKIEKEILKEATLKIKEEMSDGGYIDDSDGTYFLINLAENLKNKYLVENEEEADDTYFKEETDDILNLIMKKILCNYNKYLETNERGDCTCFYTEKKYKNLDDFIKKNNLDELIKK